MKIKFAFSLIFGLAALFSCTSVSWRAPAEQDRVRLAVSETEDDRKVHEATGNQYVISTQGRAASDAAKTIFEKKGNIVDAAVAASFTIAVERPQSTGLSGGGFMLYREAKTGRIYAIDFRERAPLKATEKMFLDEKGNIVDKLSTNGILAVGVPGVVAGLIAIHKKFGSLPLKAVVQPAIDLAENGFVVYPYLAKALEARKDILGKYPAAREIFIKADGDPYKVGEKLIQKDLAKSLRLIAEEGRKAVYSGVIGHAIIKESQRLHGLLTEEDLSQYEVKWREPVVGTYKGYQVVSMPPPSSGGTHVIEVLNVLEGLDLNQLGFQSPKAVHFIAAALQQAFADRAEYMGDPDFVSVPSKKLLSKAYAKTVLGKIPASHSRPAEEVKAGDLAGIESSIESNDTTHFSIMDIDGNVIASTQSINGWMGSGVVAPGTGIVLNNTMDDFSAKPGASNLYGAVGGQPNSIASKKTPLSSMSPTIIFKGETPVMSLGAPGGTRIISCVAETILNYLEFKLPLYESVAAIRFHHQWKPDEISVDGPGFTEDTEKSLREMGYKIRTAADAVPCRVMAVAREGNLLKGVADPRDAGSSTGR